MEIAATCSPELRVLTAEAYINSLNKRGIPYVIVNGLYGYPSNVGRDIDILIEKRSVPEAVWIAKEVKDQLGWQYLWARWSWYGVLQLYFVRLCEGRAFWLEVDLMCDDTNLLVGLVPLGTIKGFVEGAVYYKGPFRVSPQGEYLKAYFRPIFYGDVERFSSKYSLRPPSADEEVVLKALLGNELYEEFSEGIKGTVTDLKKWSAKLKWRLNFKYFLSHPFSSIRNLIWTRLLRPVLLWAFNSGLVFAIYGPDGMGKSSAISKSVDFFSGLFDLRIRHSRPTLLPAPREIIGSRLEASPAPNRRRPFPLEHWLRLLYYWTDYVVGHLVKDRFLPKSVIQLVIYDRHALDMLVDPLRYRLASTKGVWLLVRLIPRPYGILLWDDAERVASRKQELSLTEVAGQLEKWRELYDKGLVNSLIEVGDSVEETARALVEEILKVANKRFRVKRTRAWHVALRKFGYKCINVDGTCRLAWPARWAQGKKYARYLYQPRNKFASIFFNAILSLPQRISASFPRLSTSFVEKPPRLPVKMDFLMKAVAEKTGQRPCADRFILYYPPQHERNKANVVFFDQNENPLYIARLAWGQETQKLVNEVRAYKNLSQVEFASFCLPKLLAYGSLKNEGIFLALFEFLLGRRLGASWTNLPQKIWQELVEPTRHELSFFEAVNALVDGDRMSEWRSLLLSLPSAPEKVVFSSVHGDFAPWNILIVNGRPVLLDWEEYSESAPYLVDLVHYIIASEWTIGKRPVPHVARAMLSAVGEEKHIDLLLALAYLEKMSKFPRDVLLEITRTVRGMYARHKGD